MYVNTEDFTKATKTAEKQILKKNKTESKLVFLRVQKTHLGHFHVLWTQMSYFFMFAAVVFHLNLSTIPHMRK